VLDDTAKPSYTSQYDFSDLSDAASDEAAYKYADIGWRLVPVDKQTGKPVLGVGGPTRDLEKISDWLQTEGVTIGIATGQGSRIVALRANGKLGQRTLRTLTNRGTFATLEAGDSRTTHFFFRAPADVIQSRKDVAPGIDFLGERGYFVPSETFWCSRCTDLAPLPERLHDLVSGTSTISFAEQVAAGDFAALEHATAYEAAQAYSERGWKVAPVDEEGERIKEPGKFFRSELWEKKPELGVGIVTGSNTGVVGLWATDATQLAKLEGKFGPLPLPKIVGRGKMHLFRAPAERFASKGLFAGIEYLGENDSLPVPPSIVGGTKLRWEVAPDFSPDLPELPQWLYSLLSNPDRIAAAAQQPQAKQQTPQRRVPDAAPQMETAAQRYASQGWLVFPLTPSGKTPRTKNGHLAATRNQAKISQWWQRWRTANIGVKTGAESGLVVLDVDVKNNQPGLQSLAELERQHGSIETLRAHTPTGGLHLFFRAPAQVVTNRAGFLPGLDLRGQGGYIVVAPSRIDGQSYSWENPSAQIAEMPDWLLEIINAKQQKGKKASPTQLEKLTFSEALAGVQEGNRNDTIFRFACKLRQDGWQYDEALVVVKTAAGNCQPPLPEDETLRCLDSAWRYAPPTELSDIGNAKRFVARCGDCIRYVQEKDQWLVWTDHYWKSNIRAIKRMVESTIQSLRDEAAAEDNPDRKRLLFAHSRKSASVEGVNAMLELAAPELAVQAEDLDRGGLVAFTNGVFDPGTGALRPGRREDLLTKHVPIPYDPANPECIQQLGRRGSVPARRSTVNESAERLLEQFDNWLAERCEVRQGLTSKVSALIKDFSAWLGVEVTGQRFGRLLSQKGFSS
jgi:hypothetical protein